MDSKIPDEYSDISESVKPISAQKKAFEREIAHAFRDIDLYKKHLASKVAIENKRDRREAHKRLVEKTRREHAQQEHVASTKKNAIQLYY